MKILTKQEEDEHYNQTVKGGAIGGFGGLLVGGVGLYAAALRYPVFRQMSVQLRAFLLTSSTTFGAIVTADHYSAVYEKSRQPNSDYRDPAARARAAKFETESNFDRLKQWGKENKYKIVGGSWIVSIVVALSLAGRNPYLTTQQKLVQARVYAQGLTIAVMVATAILEIREQGRQEGRWETRKIIDPNDPEHKRVVEEKYWEGEGKPEPDGISEKRGQRHFKGEDQWKDMIEVEEQRLKMREELAHERQAARQQKKKHKEHGHKEENKEQGNNDGEKKNAKSEDKKQDDGGSKNNGGKNKQGGEKQKKDDKQG